MVLRFTYWFVFLVAVLGSAYGGNRPVYNKGPLHFTGQSPLQTLRLDIVPTRHEILRPKAMEFDFFNSWTNRWNKSREFLIDIEIIQNIFDYSIGVGYGTEVGASIPLITRTGGQLDKFIINFHDMFNLEQAGRNEHPRNSLSASYYIDETGEWVVLLEDKDKGTVLGDLSVFARSQIYQSQGWLKSLMLTVLFRFPTSTDRIYYGSGGTDAAFSLASKHRFNPFIVYTTLGYGMFGSGSQYGVDLRPYQWTFFAALEWPVTKNMSIIVQELSNSGTTKEYYDFNRPTHELLLGVKQYLSPRLLLEYSLMENLFNFENSIDFGLNFGLTYRL